MYVYMAVLQERRYILSSINESVKFTGKHQDFARLFARWLRTKIQ